MNLLESHNEEAAEKIKRLTFTFNNIFRIDSEGMQAILKGIDKSRLDLALKGTAEEIRLKFTQNMSARAAKLLLEEIESMGPVKLKDMYEAQPEIILITKDLIAKG